MTKLTSSWASAQVLYCGTGPKSTKQHHNLYFEGADKNKTETRETPANTRQRQPSNSQITLLILGEAGRPELIVSGTIWTRTLFAVDKQPRTNIPGWSAAGVFYTSLPSRLPLHVFPVISPLRLFKKADRLK